MTRNRNDRPRSDLSTLILSAVVSCLLRFLLGQLRQLL